MSNDADAGRKLRSAIEEYALKQSSARNPKLLEAVLDCFVPDKECQLEIQSLLIDLVFRYIFAGGRLHYNLEEPENLDERLDKFLTLHTRLTDELRVGFRRRLKQAILTAEGERPKSERKDRLLDKQRHFYCYLCGERVTEAEEQVDHIWPHNAGGGTSGDNLRKAHTACEVLKHDLAVPGDASMGRFAYHAGLPRQIAERARSHWDEGGIDASSFTTLLDDIRASSLRVALILQQDGRCYYCKEEFRIAGPLELIRIEDDLPWWPPNTILSCIPCAKEQSNANV